MSYKQAKNLEPVEFKRLCGVTPATFKQMVQVVAAEKKLAKKSGRPSKLSIEDQVLMTLEYWREYRTQFHIGVSWGLDETNVLRNIRKVENILIKSGLFNVNPVQDENLSFLISSQSRHVIAKALVVKHGLDRPEEKLQVSC